MAPYELRTYTLRVGAVAEAVKLYQELGFPALQKGGQDKKLVGYFQTDTGTINQLVSRFRVRHSGDCAHARLAGYSRKRSAARAGWHAERNRDRGNAD
jgi:hypothetical protein